MYFFKQQKHCSKCMVDHIYLQILMYPSHKSILQRVSYWPTSNFNVDNKIFCPDFLELYLIMIACARASLGIACVGGNILRLPSRLNSRLERIKVV